MKAFLLITFVSILCSIIALALKKQSPDFAVIVSLLAIISCCMFLFQRIQPLMELIREICTASELSSNLFIPVYKTAAIGLIVKVGTNFCRDTGEEAIGAVLEIAGTICALLVAVPLLEAVLGILKGIAV